MENVNIEELLTGLNAEGKISEEELDAAAGGLIIKRHDIGDIRDKMNVNPQELIERLKKTEGNRTVLALDLPSVKLS
ncbi:MAG: hypothetical protein ACI4J1_02050 [Ruminiclostridium sp.]